MRIYHVGTLFIIFISLGLSIGYSLNKAEVFIRIGFVLGMLSIVIFRGSAIRKEKILHGD